MWQRFLQLVTHEEQALIDYLQRVAGYALTGDTGAQVFFYLYGRGGTGKSTFLLTLFKLVSGYGMTTDIKTFAFGQDSPKELAKMPGKRYIYGGDVQKNTKLDIGLIKRFTGSDFVTGRDLYKKSFEFQPQGKLFFGSNFELRVDATDDAFFRRVQMIPFNVIIPKRDYQGLFADELEGIFAWAVQGAMDWYADGKGLQGLAVPQAVTNAVTAYQEDMDYMKEFIEDCLVEDPEGFITSHDLFQRYEEWCHKEKVKSDKSAVTLPKEFKKRGYVVDRKYIDGEQKRGVFGLKLLPDTGHDTLLRGVGIFGQRSDSDL
jgi:putative DNA primase/helicase